MDFENIDINELNPAEYNPRIMKPSEQLKLRKGLETFGLIDPIIVDLKHNNTIIGGHQRLEVLKEMNEDTELKLLRLGDVGLVFHETDFQIKDINDQKAMNLALNKISGEWDYNLLDDLLVDLNEEHYDLDLTGFDEFEVEDILLSDEFENMPNFDDFDEDEDEPNDLNLNIQGVVENKNSVVMLSFDDKDIANKYITNVIHSDKLLNKSSVVLKFGEDFDFKDEEK